MTAQPTLFDLNQDTDPVAWLAREVLNAHELLLIHRGDLDAARSAVTSSMRGYLGAAGEFHVQGGKVTYRHGGQEGAVPVTRVVHHAADRHDPAIGEQLAAAYSRYVEAATAGWVPGQLAAPSPDYGPATRHLSACARAWWTGALVPEPPPAPPLVTVAIPDPTYL